MPGLHAHIDPEGLEEFSVVFTDRSLNHMSARFQGVMRDDVSGMLKEVYLGSAVALVPRGAGPTRWRRWRGSSARAACWW